MPGYDVEGGMFEFCGEEVVVEFADDGIFCLFVIVVVKSCDGSLKVARVCETVGADRP